jgi:HAD superfamily hydrolase (TIGR01509 family)
MGIVTNSPQTWINRVFPRLPFKEKIDVTISLKERTDLKHKPAPDGYLEALKLLNSAPKLSIVLEDSNPGIAAGKASDCYTIGYRGNLIEGYKQEGADAYADTMEEVAKIVATRQ